MDARVFGLFYKYMVQAVLIYGSETWILTPWMVLNLEAFHHRVACNLRGKQQQKQSGGGWFYPPLEEAMQEARL